ncbi:MAG: suppressor for copper-sensitivity B [Mariniblastus sp.]|jgi:suppressor for copper-sensitivity B
MMKHKSIKRLTTVASFLLALAMVFGSSASPAAAQDLFLQEELGNFGNIPFGDPVTITSEFKITKGGQRGVLSVTAEIIPNWHLFSMNKTKGPIPTKITVAESDDYQLIGRFKPNHEPHTVKRDGYDEPCEEFEGAVTWSAPFELSAGVAPEKLAIQLVFDGQTCETGGNCQLVTSDVESEFAEYDDQLVVNPDFEQAVVEIEDFQPGSIHSTISARLIRASGTYAPIMPGDVVRLEITATPQIDYHVYAYGLMPAGSIQSTLVGFTETNDWVIKGPEESEEPEVGGTAEIPASYHHDPITWSFFVSVPLTAKTDQSYSLTGVVGLQTCKESVCDPPTGAAFSATIPIGKTSIVPVTWTQVSYSDAMEAKKPQSLKPGEAPPADEKIVDEDESTSFPAIADTPEQLKEMLGYYDAEAKINYVTINDAPKTTFWTAVFGAFVGGILLNLMPCVFPVLGLKVMGFVMQAGSEPAKIRNHGLAFTAGLVVSMWALAGFILVLKLALKQEVNWGQQMGNPYFVCGIIVLLFLLALNMAGVFEIGTSLTSVGGKVSQKKGYSGSFFSGILTTLIATPCSGPFLGAAMGYTLAQPAIIALLLFTIFALGIALPYLVLSFFPSLISKLPKPGPWMETFKVVMAFALFATVAFFAQTFGSQTGIRGLSWLLMALVVIGLAAYVYGQWSISVSRMRRFGIGYGLAGLLALTGGYMCFDASQQQGEIVSHGEWNLWAPGKVEYSLATTQPIIWVDYTADW